MFPWRMDWRGRGRELGAWAWAAATGRERCGRTGAGDPGPAGPEGMWGREMEGQVSEGWGAAVPVIPEASVGYPVT